VDRTSQFQFFSALDEWAKAHDTGGGKGTMSQQEADELWEWLLERDSGEMTMQ